MDGQRWARRAVGGVVAVAVLTHCGGGLEGGAGPEGPEDPALATRWQEASSGVASSGVALEATSDARVEASRPAGRFGAEPTLGVDASPQEESLLRFDLGDVSPATVTRAVLRLYAIDGTNNGPRVFATNPYFAELAVDWYNRGQPLSAVLADAGAIAAGGYVDFDVTAAVRTVGTDGTVGFMLRADSSDGVDFASREASRPERRPRLLLTVDPLASCLPRTDTRTLRSPVMQDGYAYELEPTRRHGSAPSLVVSGSGRRESYLRMRLDLPAHWQPRRVGLNLFVETGANTGPYLYGADPHWPADPVLGQDFDWNTRPGIFSPFLRGGAPIEPGTWAHYDLTSLMTTPGQVYSVGLVPGSSEFVQYASSDSITPANRPWLELALESDPYCTARGAGGTVGWTKRYGGQGEEVLSALATDAQGGFVALGLFGSAPFPNREGFALARYDAQGTPLWSREVTHGNVRAAALTVTPEGNILVVGHYLGAVDLGAGPLPSTGGLFLAKFSPSGQTVWTRGFTANNGLPDDNSRTTHIAPVAVATDAQGSLVVTGQLFGRVDLGGGYIHAGPASTGMTDAYAGGFVAKFTWQGQHVFSRAFEASVSEQSHLPRAVATDAQGNVLLAGRASPLANLGDGALGQAQPFVAKYGPTGTLLWKRGFPGTFGEVEAVQALPSGGVAFNANLGGAFSFGGVPYTGGEPSDEVLPTNLSGFTGRLSATGTDGWLRAVDTSWGRLGGLVVGSDGAVTLTGHAGGTYDLGGGPLGPYHDATPDTAFVARYSATGAHLGSRLFDSNFHESGQITPRLLLAPQPGGALLVGATLTGTARVDGTAYTAQGPSDLFYFRLQP
ncbi:DNRLRE domain-containing protein [Archangium primigenium]|uniref:DNRLRE domain-containing protein n=1 Tax=[Archangium] primigenium TaxID=2792470 RepID=UPI00195B1031|nr:DNRLRE domain-containing protein [Archangium primigenium]MBM7118557.1 DNRLRE domain-containing protein [Archangium primigenium]